jgi:hypothetical protein
LNFKKFLLLIPFFLNHTALAKSSVILTLFGGGGFEPFVNKATKEDALPDGNIKTFLGPKKHFSSHLICTGLKINTHLFLSPSFKAGLCCGAFQFWNYQSKAYKYSTENLVSSGASSAAGPDYLDIKLGSLYFAGLELTGNYRETLMIRFSFGPSIQEKQFLQRTKEALVFGKTEYGFSGFDDQVYTYGMLLLLEAGIQFNDDNFFIMFVGGNIKLNNINREVKIEGATDATLKFNDSRFTILAGVGVGVKIK